MPDMPDMRGTEMRTGGCLCGAVRFEARQVPAEAGICHCAQCRRWTGSALIGVAVPEDAVTWTGAEAIVRYASSDWAERGHCGRCGTPLFFRLTREGTQWSGQYDMPLGVFDDPEGFSVTSEIWIDHKPGSFAYAAPETRKQLTRAECLAIFDPGNAA